jgi:hypothetical protein
MTSVAIVLMIWLLGLVFVLAMARAAARADAKVEPYDRRAIWASQMRHRSGS